MKNPLLTKASSERTFRGESWMGTFWNDALGYYFRIQRKPATIRNDIQGLRLFRTGKS